MKWLYKLERRFGRLCVPNLMLVIVAGQAMVYLLDLLTPAVRLTSVLRLVWPYVLQGQVWRLFTFIFVPDAGDPLSLVLMLYLYYLIGHTLENTWGDFKFNVYYLCGMLGAIAGAAITGSGSGYYLNLSLFFAFAMLYPDFQLLLFFIIPIKIKYLALFSGALCLIQFVSGSMADRMGLVFSLVNFLLFFGRDFWSGAKKEITYYKNRRSWQKNQHNNWR